jgi:hypothetical protein
MNKRQLVIGVNEQSTNALSMLLHSQSKELSLFCSAVSDDSDEEIIYNIDTLRFVWTAATTGPPP